MSQRAPAWWMRLCRVCGKLRRMTASKMRRSHYICCPCDAAAQRKWHQTRREAGLRTNYTTAAGDARLAARRKTPTARRKRRTYARRYSSDPTTKQRRWARRLVRTAIANGFMERRPCGVCGSHKAEAHHDDYLQPYSVRWLCRPHHGQMHRLPGNMNNPVILYDDARLRETDGEG